MDEQSVHEAASVPYQAVSRSAGRREVLEALRYVVRALEERPRMSYEEFLAWADEDTLAEWVNGQVEMTSPATNQHQDITDFLLSVLRPFVEQNRLGIVRSAPFQMKIGNAGREPDLLFLRQVHLDRLQDTHLDGPADLVVEVMSPESIGCDRGDKFFEYERAGIPEYWLIDPQTRRAEFYRLDDQGRYQLVLPDAEGIYRSAVLDGFWLRVDWLWQPPRVLDVLRQLSLI